MHRRFPVLATLAILLAPVLASAAFQVGQNTRTITHDGIERTFLVDVPPGYDGSTAVPLVFNFHGFGSNAAQQRGISGILPVASREGFIVAHPEGVANRWNAGRCCGGTLDEIGFTRAVVASIAGEANIDPRRIYVTGLSNGGAMSHWLACNAADLFAAAAPMAFPISTPELSDCRPVRSIPVMMVMGLTDTLVDYENGEFGGAVESFEYWRDIDGCAGDLPDVHDESGVSYCDAYTQCAGGVEAKLCSVVAGPTGGTPFDGHVLYINDDYVLAEEAWAFLSRFTLPDAVEPVSATLAGTEVVSVKGSGKAKRAVSRAVTLGDGTWWLEGDDGTSWSGSAVPKGRKGRKLELTLTDVSSSALGAFVGDQVVELAGAGDVDLGDPVVLHLQLDGSGTPKKLRGNLKLGGTKGRWRLVLRPS
jgi:polyhydroxybutyrate depolymerase